MSKFGADDFPEIGPRIGANMMELIHRPVAALYTGSEIHTNPARNVHQYQRIEVDVCLKSDPVCLFWGWLRKMAGVQSSSVDFMVAMDSPCPARILIFCPMLNGAITQGVVRLTLFCSPC